MELASTTMMRSSDGRLRVPYVDDYLLLRIPNVLDGLELKFRVSYTREASYEYYGIGNAVRLADGRTLSDPYFEYLRTHATVWLSSKQRVAGPLNIELGIRYDARSDSLAQFIGLAAAWAAGLHGSFGPSSTCCFSWDSRTSRS